MQRLSNMEHLSIIFCVLVSFNSVMLQENRVRLKSVKCDIGDAADIVKIHVCKIKPARNYTMFLLNSTMFKQLNAPIYYKVVFFYKYGLIYRQVINIPEYEVCSMLRNINNAHPAIKAAIDTIGKSIEQLMKGCPYSAGNYSIKIIHDYSNFPSIIPSGMYKCNITMKLPEYRKSMSLSYEAEVISSIKTSF